MTTSNEHNNAPAVPQGLERYEPTVMVEESRGRLTATCAVMKPKEDGRWVRLRDLTATPAVTEQAVPSGEVVAWMVYGNYTRQPFGMLCSAEAYMRGLLKSDPDGGYHIRPLRYATPAPAQERCSTCGYLTSEREHLGCLRRAVKDLDIATGGPYDAQGVGLTDEALDNLIEDLSEWSRHVVEDTAHQTLEAHVREVLAKNPIIAALRAKGGK